MANKAKFTLQNLNNIINNNNQNLIDYQNMQFTIGDNRVTDENSNKVLIDQQGNLYTLKNGKRDYGFNKQKYGLMPNFCPVCHGLMGKNRHDSFFWTIHKRCYKCSMKLQNEMREQGTFDQYAINFMKNKLVATCNSAIQFYQYTKENHKKDVMINQQGDTQEWSFDNQQKFLNATNQIIKQIVEYRDKAIEYFDQKLKEIKK